MFLFSTDRLQAFSNENLAEVFYLGKKNSLEKLIMFKWTPINIENMEQIFINCNSME